MWWYVLCALGGGVVALFGLWLIVVLAPRTWP